MKKHLHKLLTLITLFISFNVLSQDYKKTIVILSPEVFVGNTTNITQEGEQRLYKNLSNVNSKDKIMIDFNYLYGDKSKESFSYKRAIYIKTTLEKKYKVKNVFFRNNNLAQQEPHNVTITLLNM